MTAKAHEEILRRNPNLWDNHRDPLTGKLPTQPPFTFFAKGRETMTALEIATLEGYAMQVWREIRKEIGDPLPDEAHQ